MVNNNTGIFTIRRIALATFLGGPVAAGLMMAHNYRVLGKRGPALHATFLGLIIWILMIWLLIAYLPPVFRETSLLTLASALSYISYHIAKKLQGPAIREYLRRGGHPASYKQIFLFLTTGVLTGAAMLLIVIYALSGNIPKVKKSNNNNITIAYTDSLLMQLADSLTSFFDESEHSLYFAGEHFVVSDLDSFYILSLFLYDSSRTGDGLLVEDLYTLQEEANTRFHFGKRLATGIYLASSGSLYLVTRPRHFFLPTSKAQDSLKVYDITREQKIYYTGDVQERDVGILARAIRNLKGYYPPEEPLHLIISRWENTYEIKYIIRMRRWDDLLLLKHIRSTGSYIQHAGLTDPIDITLCDLDAHRERRLLSLSKDTLLDYTNILEDIDPSKPLIIPDK